MIKLKSLLTQQFVYRQLNMFSKQNIPNFLQMVSLLSRLQYQLKSHKKQLSSNKPYRQALIKTLEGIINRRIR